MFKCATFITNKNHHSKDILMLAKHTHINCTSCCCFLDHNPAMGCFLSHRGWNFHLALTATSFVGSSTSFKSSWAICVVLLPLSDLTLHCFLHLRKYGKGFWLFSAITKVFHSHSSLEIESKDGARIITSVPVGFHLTNHTHREIFVKHIQDGGGCVVQYTNCSSN